MPPANAPRGRNGLQATLVSPSGTTSRLMLRESNAESRCCTLDWTFRTHAFWGEEAAGEWTVTLEDWYTEYEGVWNGFSATAYTGSLVAIPEPGALLLTCAAVGGALWRERRAPTARRVS